MEGYRIDNIVSSVAAPKGARVGLGSDGKLTLAGNTTVGIGTLERAAEVGKTASVMLLGPRRFMISQGAIAVGDALTSGTNGRVTQAAGPTSGLWTALEAATGADQIIACISREK